MHASLLTLISTRQKDTHSKLERTLVKKSNSDALCIISRFFPRMTWIHGGSFQLFLVCFVLVGALLLYMARSKWGLVPQGWNEINNYQVRIFFPHPHRFHPSSTRIISIPLQARSRTLPDLHTLTHIIRFLRTSFAVTCCRLNCLSRHLGWSCHTCSFPCVSLDTFSFTLSTGRFRMVSDSTVAIAPIDHSNRTWKLSVKTCIASL